jgi:hypothetical protein
MTPATQVHSSQCQYKYPCWPHYQCSAPRVRVTQVWIKWRNDERHNLYIWYKILLLCLTNQGGWDGNIMMNARKEWKQYLQNFSRKTWREDTTWETEIKVKQRSGQALRVPAGLGSQIFKTIGTWRCWGFQPYAPDAFTPPPPGNIPHFC